LNERRGYDELTWSYGMTADTLYIEDYLTVVLNKTSSRSLNASGGHGSRRIDLSLPTSTLKSSSGRFVIGHDGSLHNQDEIEEFGYWTTFRMAKELPRNYNGPVVFNKSTPSLIVDKLLNYQYKYPTEKVYVHTDKSHYVPYNTMWFKAYIVDAVEHTPDAESQVLYVDLINPKDDIVKSWIMHKNVGESIH